MNFSHQVRVSKIKLNLDKEGDKWATVGLSMVANTEPLELTASIERAIRQMQDDEHIESLALSETVPQQTLSFWPAPDIEKPCEVFQGVELTNFKLSRSTPTEILLSFTFTVPVELAHSWIIPAFGDQVYCQAEETQPRLPLK